MHELAGEHGCTVIFVHNTVIPLRKLPTIKDHITPFYRANKTSGKVSIYPGCGIKSDTLEDLPRKLTGLMRIGIFID